MGASNAFGQPAGAQVIQGQAQLQQQGNSLVVTTQNALGTNRSVINWQSFSVPAGSTARFDQPSAQSLSINRVVGNDPSAIFGTLSSNGRLVLVNPAGIAVGAGAVVDTAGFTASTLRLSEADAQAGRLVFGGDGLGGGPLKVDGSILARSGDVVLAPNVQVGSQALVQAPSGATILAAGQKVELTGRGLEGIRLELQAPADQAVNLGTLQGDAVGIFAAQLKHSGLIQATAVSTEGGKVVLKGQQVADISGTTEARSGDKGGQVHVTANKVMLRSGSVIDVSGAHGGGEALIGGGWQGNDSRVANAKDILIEANAVIKADALVAGDGGTVVAWSDGATRVYGSISARGGTSSGNGGKVETSGHYLDMQGSVDTRAPNGTLGQLLLDPTNIYIADSLARAQTSGMIGSDASIDGAVPPTLTATPTGSPDDSLLTTSRLNSLLANNSVMVQTNSDATAPTGNIHVVDAVSWASPNSLSLSAAGGITVNAPITASTGTLSLRAYGGNISQSVNGAISVPELLAIADTGSITLTNSANAVSLLAGYVGSGKSYSFTNNAPLTVGTVLGSNGVEAFGGGTVSLTTYAGDLQVAAVSYGVATGSAGTAAGSVSLTATNGGITINGPVTSGNINLSAAGTLAISGGAVNATNSLNVAGARINVNGTSSLAAGAGGIALQADRMDLQGGAGSINGGGGIVTVKTATAGRPIDLGITTDAAAALELSASELNLFAGTGVLHIGDPTAGSINISSSIAPQFGGMLSLESGGTITQASSAVLGASKLKLKAAGGITLKEANQVSSLSVGAGTMYVSFYDAAYPLELLAVDVANYVDIRSADRLLISGPVSSDGGGVTLQSGPGNSVVVQSSVDSGTGPMLLQSGGLIDVSSATLSTSNAAVSMTAAGLVSINSSSITTGSGAITIQGGGPAYLNASILTALGGNVVMHASTISQTGGGITASGLMADAEAVTMSGNNDVQILSGRAQSGDFKFNNVGTVVPLEIATVAGIDGIQALGGVVEVNTPGLLKLNQLVSSNASGNAITLVAKDLSTSGGSLSASSGRWAVFLQSPTGPTTNLVGSPGSGNSAVWNRTFTGDTAASLPEAGNRYVFAFQPQVTVIVDPATKVYDGTNSFSGLTATVTGIPDASVSGNVFSVEAVSLNPLVSSKNVGSYPIALQSLFQADAYAFTYTPAMADITPAVLTASITAADKVYDGSAAAASSFTITGGLIGSETVSASGAATFADKNAGIGKTVTANTVSLADGANGGLASNYTLAVGQTTTADITAATLTISAASDSRVYDGTTVSSLGPVVAGLVGGDTLSGLSQSFDSKNAGPRTLSVNGGYTLTDGNGGNNYVVTTANSTGSITAAALTISAATEAKTYDATTGGFNAPSVSGLMGSDTVSGLGQSFDSKNAGGRILTVNGGYTVNDGNSGNNYTVTTASKTGTITPAPLTVAAINQSKQHGDTFTFTGLEIDVTGLQGGEQVKSAALSSAGALQDAAYGNYLITAGGSLVGANGFSASNYTVTYQPGVLVVSPVDVLATQQVNNQVVTFLGLFVQEHIEQNDKDKPKGDPDIVLTETCKP
jgi:filamentous hemagglutinin family protein